MLFFPDPRFEQSSPGNIHINPPIGKRGPFRQKLHNIVGYKRDRTAVLGLDS